MPIGERAAGTGSLPSVLMDLRPCYEGFAGIPQEIRILFRMFAGLGLPRLGGFASGTHHSSRPSRRRTPYDQVLAQTRALISQDTKRHHVPLAFKLLPRPVRHRLRRPYLVLSEAGRDEKLDLAIDPAVFDDYLWMKLFDPTLQPDDRHIVEKAEFIASELGHEYARALSLLPRPFQRQVRTTGWDVFLAGPVSPYRVAPGTSMIIRYYDALPLLSPHTIGEPWPHAMSHGRMLQRNMQDGAFFVCDSEPVRDDVLRLFPKAERRVGTIPAAIAPGYKPDPRPASEVATILHRRANEQTMGRLAPGTPVPRYFLAVSTLEPRKNYLKLFRAFEIARRIAREPIQLVVVANTGWRSHDELAELKALVREGAYHLSKVPLEELRVLYSMAHCVVAPSRAEGFDYSGAEAMVCGSPVIASDIPVHRWVYGDAAAYVDAYDADAMGRMLGAFADLPRESGQLAEMRDRGFRQAAAYTPATLAPRWARALEEVMRSRGAPAASARNVPAAGLAGGS